MKTFQHFTSLLILSVVFLLSCDKENGHTIVKGTVVDNTTNQPVPNSTVYLGRSNSNIWGGGGFADVAQYASDGNGNFEFAFEAENGYSYALGASAENYYENTSQLVFLEKGKKNKNVEVGLTPKGYIRLHVQNVNPYDNFDLIYVSSHFNVSFSGTDTDTTVIFEMYGNSSNDIYWGVTKNGVENNHQDSICPPAFDTTFYEILY